MIRQGCRQLRYLFFPTITLLSIVALAGLNTGCSKSSEDPAAAASALSQAFPNGFALSSVLAGKTSSAPSLRHFSTKASTFNSSLSYADKVAKINSILAGTTVADCQVTLPVMTASTAPTCYGPVLYYQNHPEWTSGMPAASGSLPPGDLGLWTSAESSGEACAAAKLNQLVTDISAKEDTALLLSASLICLMNVKGTVLPAAGAEAYDLTTDMNTAVTANNTSATITSATLQRLADSGDNPVYQISIAGTNVVNSSTVTMTFNLKHMPTNSDNSTYQGKIWGSMIGLNVPGDNRQANAFFSLGYERTSTLLKAQMQFAGTKSTIVASDALADDGTINWTNVMASSGANSANLNQIIMSLDPDTGVGSASYAWQAGGQDGATRVFNVYTSSSDGTASGCGFFGYGPAYTTSGAPDNSISKFICNWAGPGNNHTGLTSMAQKQCMTQDATSGLFTSVSLKEKITYAPVTTCSVAQGSSFTYGKTSSPDGTWTTFTSAAVTNNLVDLTSDTDFALYTAPTAPTTP